MKNTAFEAMAARHAEVLEVAQEEVSHYGKVTENTAMKLSSEAGQFRIDANRFMEALSRAAHEGKFRPQVDVYGNTIYAETDVNASLFGGCSVM